jgi:Zn-dependent protease with chaperone function
VLVLGALLVATCVANAQSSAALKADFEAITRQFDDKLEQELTGSAPDAVPVLKEANAARRAKKHEQAVAAYARLRQLAPTFTAAARRQCQELLELGRRDEALALCREAAKDGSADNIAGLAHALVESKPNRKVTPLEIAEAIELAEKAIRLAPDDYWVHTVLCAIGAAKRDNTLLTRCTMALEKLAPPAVLANYSALHASLLAFPEPGVGLVAPAALSEAERLLGRAIALYPRESAFYNLACQLAQRQNDLDGLRGCVAKLERLAASDSATHAYAAILAASEGRHSDARAALDKARSLGLADEAYNSLSRDLDAARPFYERWGVVAAWLLAIWSAGAVLLVAAGMSLSYATLRTATRAPAERSGRAQGSDARLRQLYAVVLWMCCAYYYASIPLVALTVIALAGGLVFGMLAAGFIPIKLLIIAGMIAVVTLGAIARSLFVRVDDSDPGMRLDLDEHPRLRAVLQEVAAKVGTHPVHSVFMTPGTDVAVFERGGMLDQLRGKSERCLVIGAGVLGGMSLEELKAVLAHEYGHFSNRDTAGGGFALAVRRSLVSMAIGIARGGAATWYNPAWLFVMGFDKVFLRISHGASRLQEILADRWAAFAYGSAAFERGLRHVIERSVRFEMHAQATLNEVLEHKLPLANLYRYRPKAGIDSAELESAIAEALEREPSPYDSHPSPKDRLAWVRALNAPGEAAQAEEKSWSLFSDRKQLERAMTGVVRETIADKLGVSIRAARVKAEQTQAEG